MEAAAQPSRAATSLAAASAHPSPPAPPAGLALSDTGATLIEYGLMVALVALAALLAVTAFGIEVNNLINKPELLDALS